MPREGKLHSFTHIIQLLPFIKTLLNFRRMSNQDQFSVTPKATTITVSKQKSKMVKDARIAVQRKGQFCDGYEDCLLKKKKF